MKSTVFLSMFAIFFSGCIIVENDDGNPAPGEMFVTWDLYAGFPTGAVTDCVGGDQIIIQVRPSAGGAPLPPICADCRDGSALLQGLPPNVYDVLVQLTDSLVCDIDPLPLAQSDNYLDVDIIDSGKRVPVEFDVDGGYFQVSWSFAGMSLSQGCNGAGPAMQFQTLPTEVGNPEFIEPTRFPCVDGIGELAKLPIGAYTLVMDLLDESGDPLPGFTVDRLNQHIDFGNHQPVVQEIVY